METISHPRRSLSLVQFGDERCELVRQSLNRCFDAGHPLGQSREPGVIAVVVAVVGHVLRLIRHLEGMPSDAEAMLCEDQRCSAGTGMSGMPSGVLTVALTAGGRTLSISFASLAARSELDLVRAA